jgi:hypothetical protein
MMHNGEANCSFGMSGIKEISVAMQMRSPLRATESTVMKAGYVG